MLVFMHVENVRVKRRFASQAEARHIFPMGIQNGSGNTRKAVDIFQKVWLKKAKGFDRPDNSSRDLL